MEMNAYDSLYVEDAMHCLGDMMEYAESMLGLDPVFFYRMFLSHPIAMAFEKGHPKYISGMSGYEIARMLITEVSDLELPDEQFFPPDPGESFWAGWSLAYFQWKTGLPFRYIEAHGFSMETVLGLYHPLHEADLSKFVEIGLERIHTWNTQHKPNLKKLRKNAGMTQRELAECSGVSLRMIRAYEQEAQDISKAEAGKVSRLAAVLGTRAEALLDIR